MDCEGNADDLQNITISVVDWGSFCLENEFSIETREDYRALTILFLG